jgi:hypothetical protein
MAGMPRAGTPASSTPKAQLAAMMKPRGFQLKAPTRSPSSLSITSDSSRMPAPIAVRRMPSTSGK